MSQPGQVFCPPPVQRKQAPCNRTETATSSIDGTHVARSTKPNTYNNTTMPPRQPTPRLFALPPRFLCPSLPTTQTRSIRSILKPIPKPSRFNASPSLPVLGASHTAAFERKEHVLPLRTGAIAIKKGMTALYDPETSKRTPCTVLQLDRCQVVSHKRRDVHGYWAVQVGAGAKEARNVTRPERGHFAVNGVPLSRHLAEFRVKTEEGLPPVGSAITADLFIEGQFIDARANRRGMGFEGGMKRWNFSGQPASHGNSLAHRLMGSSGGGQGMGSRVLPGKKMPGRMGGEQATVSNLRVMKIDKENGIVVVHGAVPGPKNCVVKLQDAIKKPWPNARWPPVADAPAA